MPESPDQNSPTAQSAVPPPPPSDSTLAEVSIRTMASDLALLGKTGGIGTPQGETVSLTFTHHERSRTSDQQHAVSGKTRNAAKIVMIIFGIVLLGAALFVAGYYLFPQVSTGEGS